MTKIITAMLLMACIVFFNSFMDGESANAPKSLAELGELLFNDPILSSDKSISCASCHRPDFGFADTSAVSVGVLGRKGTRNTPSVLNMKNRARYFWDGRASSLEQQALMPIENKDEMNLSIAEAVLRLRESKKYKKYFLKLQGRLPDKEGLASALAAFERTLETGNSPFDKYMNDDDQKAISASAKRGHQLFLEKGKCFDCHFSPDFTADEFKNIGLYDEQKLKDKGRFTISNKTNDLGRFKVPGLRNIALTAPYMHNGMFKTLRQVIDYYDNPSSIVPNPINRDTSLSKPLNLTEQEKQDLEAFLISLTGSK
jgi:cytochrome c peroxidase